MSRDPNVAPEPPYSDEQFYDLLGELLSESETIPELEMELAKGITNPEEAGRLIAQEIAALRQMAHERLIERDNEGCCA